MRRLPAAVVLLLMAAPAGAALPPSMSEGPVSRPQSLSVSVDRTALHVTLGGRFGFSSTVRNLSGRPLGGLIAHLNVLSSDPGTYVDPEDWSTRRSQFLDVLPANGSATLAWPMQAVNSGPLVLYVAVTDTRAGQSRPAPRSC